MLLPGQGLAAAEADALESYAELTLWVAVERALDSHPSVAAARAAQDAATATRGEAEASRRPTVALIAAATHFAEPMVITPIHAFEPGATPQFDRTLIQASVRVSYLVFDAGKRRAKIDQAQARADAAGAGSRLDEQAVVARTVATYLGVLGLGEIVAAHDERLVALDAERDRVRRWLEAGRAPEVELRRAEAALAAARAERVTLAASLATTERDLARLIGGDLEEARAHRLVAVGLADQAAADRHGVETRAVEASPAVARARQLLLAAEAARALAKASTRPDLATEGRYLELGSAQGSFSGEWSAGLELTVPLYAGGAHRQRVAKAEADRALAAEQLKLAVLEVGERLDRALAAAEEAAARRQSLEQAALSFDEVARTERLRLEVGSGTQTDYLDAEADRLVTRAALAQARHAELAARSELARVTGDLDLPWLRRTFERAP